MDGGWIYKDGNSMAGNTILSRKAIPADAIGSKSPSRILEGKRNLIGAVRRLQWSNDEPCCEDGCSACREVVIRVRHPVLLPWEMHQVMKELKAAE